MTLVRRLQLPLLLVLAVAVVTITVLSPAGPGQSGGASAGAALVEPPLPAKQRVPVRLASAPAGQARPGDLVALRQLVIATDTDDFGLATWKSVLDEIGSPYDVLLAGKDKLTTDKLVRADGVGRYDAVLLTNNALLHADASGNYTSMFDDAQWHVLWDYERAYHVRQVTLNAFPGATPEDYCLRSHGEGPVGTTPALLDQTTSEVFDYLDPHARIPLTQSYLYQGTLTKFCPAEPILTYQGNVVGVLSPSLDGRERIALTFSTGPDAVSTLLLGYGLVRWATKGVLIGEQRHWFNVDVDDWFNVTLRQLPDGSKEVFRISGQEAASIAAQQRDLREKYPLAKAFTLNMPFNGSRFDVTAPDRCSDAGTSDPLSSYTKCLVDQFRWINHTATHPQMNTTSYDVSLGEIKRNLDVAATGGLPVPKVVLKTPEYSGLGVYNPDPTSLAAPTDHGLAASNKALLDAAYDMGVRYVEGNMSFASHRPGCFNCGIDHPLRPGLFVVPDWPTNIAFEATTPAEETTLYNAEYGRNGTASDHANHDLDYPAVIDAESDVALRQLMVGSSYAHTLHQGNLHEYAPGRSLTFDWIKATVDKYSSYYAVPLENTDWVTLAHYVQARTQHFALLAARNDAIWNRATNAVSYTPADDGSLFLTGIQSRPADPQEQWTPDSSEIYGSDTVSQLGLAKGNEVVVMASPRS
ncbi:hypothetical protein [Actinocrispum wychmicini]|uniref:Agd3 CBM87 domain-containing protein n=1 Tax=Actinocrispum wychmicini TaxID=1213861 RepID=A0A4R2JP59_9PSEU|nr:hypothetical protein [Actinocrispum wychmicini]TCO60542.1 hypothetical protein EV192_103117 [Actinocrispum wychmicini]